MKKMTINEVIEYIENDDTFDDFAVRGDDYIPNGQFHNSWYHGDEMEEFELPGVSAIGILDTTEKFVKWAVNRASMYGKHVYLLRGEYINADEETHDAGEVLMTRHEVICEIVW